VRICGPLVLPKRIGPVIGGHGRPYGSGYADGLFRTGDAKYEEMLRAVARRYHKKIAICLRFDESMAHQIYAGSDLFMMPSVYEPCGLSQLISLRYGTIPMFLKPAGLRIRSCRLTHQPVRVTVSFLKNIALPILLR